MGGISAYGVQSDSRFVWLTKPPYSLDSKVLKPAFAPCGKGDSGYSTGKTSMQTGTVKWFNPIKGYGFIEPEDGSKDAFVHITAVQKAGLQDLREGQRVQFDLTEGRNGKTAAENLSLLD